MCGKNQTTTSSNTQTYTPTGQAQLQDIWNKIQGVASTPYQAYTGQQVANLDPTQTAGVANVNSSVGSAQPLFNQAIQYGQQGAAPISQNDIERYQSPYTQSVIDATQRNFNENNQQQQQQVIGNAAMKGALGGDRVGVAQAELARQQKLAQDPVIAGLQNQGYTQALGAAQQDRSAAAQGAYTFGSLAPAVQNTGIAGGNAQIAAGSVPQQNQQQQLSALYQNYMQQQAFPYQQAQFLASYGLPAVTAQGGTQSGSSTTTQPGPSLFGQIAGLGTSALGAFSGSPLTLPFTSPGKKTGGRVRGYASGGSPMGAENFILMPSYIPRGQAPQAQTPQIASMQTPKATAPHSMSMPSAKSMAAGMSGLGNLYKDLKLGDDGNGNWNDYSWDGGTPLEGSSPIGFGGIGSKATGGAVSVSPYVQGYDLGGPVEDGPLSFEERAFPAQEAIKSGTFDPSVMNYTPFTQDPQFAPPAVTGNVPLPQARPATPQPAQTAVALPPQITNPDNLPDDDNTALAYSADAPPTGIAARAQGAPAPEEKGGIFGTNLFNLSPEARAGLITAGLGMLASRSPFAASAIGEGGLKGMQAYTDAKKLTVDQAVQKQRVDLEAKRLAQSASQFATTSGETKRYHDILDQQRKDALDERKTRSGYTRNPDGTMSPIKGGPADPEQLAIVAKAKQTGALLPDETANFMADRVLAGDTKALIGLGRGAQGAENIAKIQTLVAKKAAEQGLNPLDIMAKAAEQSGLNAQQRTFGTQVARMAVNSTEAQGAIELGREASKLVPRGNWVPITKAIQAFQSGTSDPNLAKFGAANLAIINTYSRAISPTGVPTVHDKEHAERLLSTATGPDAYNAVLDQMNKEIEIAHAAPLKAKREMEIIRKSGQDGGHTPAPNAAPSVSFTGRTASGPGGKKLRETSDGKWVP